MLIGKLSFLGLFKEKIIVNQQMELMIVRVQFSLDPPIFSGILAVVACQPHKLKVDGAIPSPATIFFIIFYSFLF